MDARKPLAVELIAKPHRLAVADLERQRNRFRDDVIRRQQVIREPTILKLSEDFDDALVVCVPLGHECEQKSGVDEDHAFGWPYR